MGFTTLSAVRNEKKLNLPFFSNLGSDEGSLRSVFHPEEVSANGTVTMVRHGGPTESVMIVDLDCSEDLCIDMPRNIGHMCVLSCLNDKAVFVSPEGERKTFSAGNVILLPYTLDEDAKRYSVLLPTGGHFVGVIAEISVLRAPSFTDQSDGKGTISSLISSLFTEDRDYMYIKALPMATEVFRRMAFTKMRSEAVERLFLRSCLTEALSYAVEAMMGRSCEDKRPAQRLTLDAYELARIREVPEEMEKNLMTPSTIDELSRKLGISNTKLQKGFRYIYGVSVYQYYKKMKLNRAMELIKSSDMSIREIAFHCGYASQGQFSTAFRKEFGVQPSKMRSDDTISVMGNMQFAKMELIG